MFLRKLWVEDAEILQITEQIFSFWCSAGYSSRNVPAGATRIVLGHLGLVDKKATLPSSAKSAAVTAGEGSDKSLWKSTCFIFLLQPKSWTTRKKSTPVTAHQPPAGKGSIYGKKCHSKEHGVPSVHDIIHSRPGLLAKILVVPTYEP